MLEVNFIQVAGVIDEAEAELLQQCGVRFIGVPLRLPVHREDLSEMEAARIISALKPPCQAVLISYLNRADEITAFRRSIGARIVQLHGDIDRSELKQLKSLDPKLTVIKSLVVGLHDPAALESSVEDLSPYVDAFITDTFDPTTGASGATGKTHDWAVSRRLVDLSPRPVILAGGLTPENVRRAIMEVNPAGVDVHTGVEDASGRKDRAKVEKFVSESRTAYRIAL